MRKLLFKVNPKGLYLSAMLYFAASYPCFAQDISDFNSSLTSSKTDFVDLLSTIFGYLVIAAFLFLVVNIIFKLTDNKVAFSTFFIVIILKGVFTLFS